MIRNKSGKVSKTKIGSTLIGFASTIEAVALVPGLPPAVVPWLHVAAVLFIGIGVALGGIGIRDALNNKNTDQ